MQARASWHVHHVVPQPRQSLFQFPQLEDWHDPSAHLENNLVCKAGPSMRSAEVAASGSRRVEGTNLCLLSHLHYSPTP